MKLTEKPMFLHLREHYVDNTQSDQLELALSPKGGATIAFTYNNNSIKYAVAYCNVKDHFCKHTGRVKAEGRLKSQRYAKELPVKEDITVSEVINLLKDEVYKEKKQYDEQFKHFVF